MLTRFGTGIVLAAALSFQVQAEENTFTNWRAACAPDSICTTYTPAMSGPKARLQFDRATDADAQWAIGFTLTAPFPDDSRPIQIGIDGTRATVLQPDTDYALYGDGSALYMQGGKAPDGLFARLRAGNTARLSYIDVTGAPRDADFSLAGLSAGLLWIAEQQGYDRIGSALSAPRHLAKQEFQNDAELIAGQGIPDALYRRHMDGSDCEDPYSERLSRIDPIIGALSQVTTLYAIPCTAHAYNVTYRLYALDRGEIGGMETLYFAHYTDRFGWSGSDLLFNVSFEPETATLTAFYKGRGLADCGNAGEWAWDDYAFKLKSFRSHDKCDGKSGPDKWEKVFP